MSHTVPLLEFSFEVRADVGRPIEVGPTPRGRRRVVPILGGTFEGSRLKGRVVPGGADWQLIHDDGFTELDSRYALETETGDVIAVRNAGIRRAEPEVMKRLLAGETVDPALVYFKTSPTFETASAGLTWLTQSVFVGVGERQPLAVVIRFWRMV